MFKIIRPLLFSMLTLSTWANSMYFEVDSIDMRRNAGDVYLGGQAFARDIYIKYDAVEFDLTENGELFLVDTYLYNNKINFKKDNLNLSTHIPQFKEIDYLSFIYAKDAKIEFAHNGFFANGPQLSLGADKFLVDIKNVDIRCDSDDFTFRLDQICLQSMTIKPHVEEDFAKLEIKQDYSDQSYIEILGKSVIFAKDFINIDAQNVTGNLLDTFIEFNAIQAHCYKDPKIKSFNLDLIFAGCLQESKVIGKEIKLLREGKPFNIFNGQVYFEKEHAGLVAHELMAQTNKGQFTFSEIEARCSKLYAPNGSIDSEAIYIGCLRKSTFTIDRISEDGKDSRNNRIRDLNVLIENGKFKFSAKLRAFFTINMKASGSVEILESQREVNIKVSRARIAGLSATKLVLKFIMKFITSDSVSLNDDTITIKY